MTTGKNLFQHWMQKNSKVNKTELTSLLTATAMKMNWKYWKPSPQVCERRKIKGKWKERKLVANVF